MMEEGSAEDIMDGNLGIYKGAVYENVIADIFAKNGKNYIIMKKIPDWKWIFYSLPENGDSSRSEICRKGFFKIYDFPDSESWSKAWN